MCIDLAECGNMIRRETCVGEHGEDEFMDCGRESFDDIQQYRKELPSLHFVLMAGVD